MDFKQACAAALAFHNTNPHKVIKLSTAQHRVKKAILKKHGADQAAAETEFRQTKARLNDTCKSSNLPAWQGAARQKMTPVVRFFTGMSSNTYIVEYNRIWAPRRENANNLLLRPWVYAVYRCFGKIDMQDKDITNIAQAAVFLKMQGQCRKCKDCDTCEISIPAGVAMKLAVGAMREVE